MNQLRVLFLLITIALLSAACKENSANTGSPNPATPPASPAASTDEFSAARLTYAKSCASCHGNDGQGGVAEVEGKKIAAFLNWKRYQYIQKPQKSTLPAPPETAHVEASNVTVSYPSGSGNDSGNGPVRLNRIEVNRKEVRGKERARGAERSPSPRRIRGNIAWKDAPRTDA